MIGLKSDNDKSITDLKMFQWFSFYKKNVGGDQLIMKCMAKSALYLLLGILFEIPDTVW